MTSGHSEFYILARSNAIVEWRKLMGPTKVFKAQFSDPESIRGKYGLSDTRNATHGSDSPQSATREINIFFPNFDVKSWYENEELMHRMHRVKFLENEFIHIPDIP
ncbi:nmdyn-D6 [Carabus blaptoides fortunei]